VFSAGDRRSVVERAKAHDFGLRSALFLIDGDFEWVRDEAPPEVVGIHRLSAYCIENLLLDEDAAVQVIIEDAVISEERARNALAFRQWLDEISEPLVELFTSFAVLNLVRPDEPTVGRGIGSVITSQGGSLPELDRVKLEALRRDVDKKAAAVVGQKRADEIRKDITKRAASLSFAIDIVSGKDFLMPLFEFRLRRCTNLPIRRSSLRVRLARRCNAQRFVSLTAALRSAARSSGR
jgi:hypothetical protein